MATKRRRGSAWHYTIRRSAVLPRPIYLSFHDEAEGDEYVARLEALLAKGVVPDAYIDPVRARPLLRRVVAEYLDTQPVGQEDADLLDRTLHGLPVDLDLSALSYQWAERWITSLKRITNLSPSTIRHRVGALARCLDWLTRSGRIPFNPLRSLPRGYARYTAQDIAAAAERDGVAKADNERDRRLEEGEEPAIRAILAGAKPRDRQRALTLHHPEALVVLFDMGLETAMRMREMYTLRVHQIDLDRRTIFLDRTKNGDKRQVPISSTLLTILQPYLDGRGRDDLVFPWWDGKRDRSVLRRVTARLSRQYARVFSAAECVDLHFHDLRHEATSRIYERTTLSDVEIASITGHKDLRQLKRYANLRGSKLAERLW